jgi:hypothetical protein
MAETQARQIHEVIKEHSYLYGNLSIVSLAGNPAANCRYSCQVIHKPAV